MVNIYSNPLHTLALTRCQLVCESCFVSGVTPFVVGHGHWLESNSRAGVSVADEGVRPPPKPFDRPPSFDQM